MSDIKQVIVVRTPSPDISSFSDRVNTPRLYGTAVLYPPEEQVPRSRTRG